MKQEIKKATFLFLMIGISTASQEKTCTSKGLSSATPIALEKSFNKNPVTDTDIELLFMPVSQFIILQ